jgi:carbon monoxide dehydrogenase subunit G
MVTINQTLEINASLEKIWEIVSDVDKDPNYWSGVNSLRTTIRRENLIERDVKVGFLGHEGHQIIKLNPKESVQLEMTQGPLKGSRTIQLVPIGEKTKLVVAWDFRFSAVPTFARSFVKTRLEEVTEQAMQKIALAAQAKNAPLASLG